MTLNMVNNVSSTYSDHYVFKAILRQKINPLTPAPFIVGDKG